MARRHRHRRDDARPSGGSSSAAALVVAATVSGLAVAGARPHPGAGRHGRRRSTDRSSCDRRPPRSPSATARVLIWGGRATTSDSGWVYDPTPGTWQKLPPAPGPSRFSAGAVWTGTEAMIWGGSIADPFRFDPGGVAWNPSTGSWRELPAAPVGLMDARAVAFDAGVLFTGGRGPTGGHPTDLWFDLASETWSEVPNEVQVRNVAWQDGRLVGTGPTPCDVSAGRLTSTWEVLTFDPLARTWSQAAPTIDASWLALAPGPSGELTAVSADGETIRGFALTHGQWVQHAEIRSGAVVTIEPTGYPPATVWTGDQLVLGAQGGLVGVVTREPRARPGDRPGDPHLRWHRRVVGNRGRVPLEPEQRGLDLDAATAS